MTPGPHAWLPSVIERLAQVPAVVRIVVAQVQGSTPREPGAYMLLDAAGVTGTIGGGRLEWEAVGAAQELLQRGECAARLMNRVLGVDLGQCCGGVVAVWLECFPQASRPELEALAGQMTSAPAVLSTVVTAAGVRRSLSPGEGMVTPRVLTTAGEVAFLERLDEEYPGVWLYGAGHVGQSLAGMLVQLPLRLQWLDSRLGQFPPGAMDYSRVLSEPELVSTVAEAPAGTFFVVMTHDHALDYELCRAVLMRADAGWLGLIGSQSKAARFRSRLRRAGVGEQAIERMVCPIGVAGVKSKWPAAIAVAIAAQLMQLLSHAAQGDPGAQAAHGGDDSCAAGDCGSCRRQARKTKGIVVIET
jgi:xanthine dehydrogenase accessory factor